MLRMFVELQQILDSARDRVSADEGTTLPEYMLVLGFISVAIIAAFDVSGTHTAITAVSADLIDKVTPGS